MATSWVPGSMGSGFPIQNLAFGACRVANHRFLGVRIGASTLDLRAVADAGGFDGLASSVRDALRADDLGPLLAEGRPTWTAVRQRLGALLVAGSADQDTISPYLVPVDDVELGLPFPVADFVDFYSSIDHASNIGHMFRPDAEPLLPNWRHLPVGYHGRAGTVVVSGTPVVRPSGQRLEDGAVVFGPSTKLDIELEVGFVLGGTSRPGHPVDIAEAREHVFGVVLLNDWSARDIQSWEYVPLGPFLGKSFATTISGWVVPIDALDPFRVPGPDQDPPVLPYLERVDRWGLDLALSVDLRPAGATVATTICEVGFAGTYWTPDQQLAHLTVNGATVRPGDLFGSGTVSGPAVGQRGSLIEASWNGAEPVAVAGDARSFLADGDEVVLRGHASRPGTPRIDLGDVTGTVVASAARLDSDPSGQRDSRS
ncbi:MAG: fumarylacetoacetase [Acidimicrobiales bacterium]